MAISADAPETQPEGARKDGRRARTRERLLDAALELLRHGGIGAVTVSRVARRVGVHHSLFYQHFRNTEGCLGEATGAALATLAPLEHQLCQDLAAPALGDRRMLARSFDASLERWLEHRSVLELLLAHRLDASPVGQVVRPALARLREDLAAELWNLAARLGVDGKHIQELRTLADLLVDQWLWALECLVDGRASDRAELAARFADLHVSLHMAFFGRTRRRPHGEVVAAHFDAAERERMADERAALRAYIQAHSDAELIAEAGSAELLVERVLEGMCATFLPLAAGHASAVVHYDIAAPGRAVLRRLSIRDQTCTTDALCDAAHPRVTLAMPLRTLLETASGLKQENQAYGSGELRVTGDLWFLVEYFDWFFHA